MNNLLTKGYSIRGADGNDLRIEETVDRMEVVVSITDTRSGKVNTVRLDYDQYDAFSDLFTKYSINRLDIRLKEEFSTEE
jgi:hypothetical protein